MTVADFASAKSRAAPGESRVIVGNRRYGGWWWRIPILLVLWLSIASPIVVVWIVTSTLRGYAARLPDVPDLAEWRAAEPQSSRLLAADGTVLAELPFRDGKVVGHRTRCSLDRLPAHVIDAVLAAEDVRFWEHKGADYQAIVRAAWINYKSGRVVEGASTITQQVVRNVLPEQIGTERSARRKVREVLVARRLERESTKREILATYLDLVFLGEGAYGIVAGARAYFDRDVEDLDLPQAAMLAGLIQAPARLDPFHHPKDALARRNEVLARMARAHLIDEPTRARAAKAPLELHARRERYGSIIPWYTEQVRRLIAEALPGELARGGLTIDTAALPALGEQLQREAAEQSERWKGAQVAALIWDHRTGYVEAIVGGRDWDPDRFDRVIQSCRQPGSAWKPILYGAALEAGAITPGTPLRDAPIADYDEVNNVTWKPKSGNRFRGVVLAQDALAASLNAPAIDVLDRVGIPRVVKFARRLGITSAIANLRPMALGASCVKPIELARVYATYARGGWSIAPRFAIGVRRGTRVLFDASVPEDPMLGAAHRYDRIAALAGTDPDVRVGADGGRLVDAPYAFQIDDMMAAVTARGTAAAARALHRPTAGKTGTTNDNTDAWFLGFTGRVLAAVWVGFDDPTHKLGREGEGAHAALPLWMRAIRAAEGDRPPIPVPGPPPAQMVRVTIDRESGQLAAPGAPGLRLWYREGTVPTEVAGQPATTTSDFGRSAREF